MSDEQSKTAIQTISLLQAAGEHGTMPVANLLAQGLDVNLQDAKKNTALMVAASHKRAQTLKLLLSKGASVTLKNDRNSTALHCAFVADTSPDCVKILIDNFSDINAQNIYGHTPFHVGLAQCAINDHETEKALMLLIQAGADLLIPNKENETAAFLLTKKTYRNSKKYPPSLVQWGQMVLDRQALADEVGQSSTQSPPRQSKL